MIQAYIIVVKHREPGSVGGISRIRHGCPSLAITARFSQAKAALQNRPEAD